MSVCFWLSVLGRPPQGRQHQSTTAGTTLPTTIDYIILYYIINATTYSPSVRIYVDSVTLLRLPTSADSTAFAMDQRSTVSTELELISTKIKVQGFDINYFQVGNGPKKLLIFPGVLGQISDFAPLTENLDGEKYTIYICDPPGYGLSRPPNRDFSPGFLYRDADSAIALMETLGIDRYSMLGWCNGGCTAMIAASRAADRVDKLVVWSCNAYVTAKDLEYYETTRDVHGWPEARRLSQFETYGEKYVSDTWSGWIDAFRKILDDDDGDVCRGALAKINAPTLILHGAKDVFVPVEHGVYLHENINSSTLEIFPEGKHIIQFMYPEKFVSIVDNFLSSMQ